MNKYIDPKSLVSSTSLSFLWIELTNKCNLECIHCYADSSPHWVDKDPLSAVDYEKLLTEAHEGGCRAVQFIGGEPTLNKDLPYLLKKAYSIGYSHIEVYSNLVSLSASLIEAMIDSKALVATSVYADHASIHDEITERAGSFDRTRINIEKLLTHNIPIRASFIEMENNNGQYESTRKWLLDIGIENIGYDEARAFGRANTKKVCEMGELCGECSKGTLCVDPEGSVSPCIMSKPWGVGNLKETSLTNILSSDLLRDTRQAIHKSTNVPHESEMGGCNPSSSNPCGPDSGSCSPCSPNGHCGPNSCAPK